MLYLALGGALLVGYLWLTGGKVPILKRREWRILTAAVALVAFTAAVKATSAMAAVRMRHSRRFRIGTLPPVSQR